MQRMPYALLARRIQTCRAADARPARIALIGPPGAGKTTTLAKLAARYVLEQDAANLLIISTDDERLGSHEQLRSLGRLLGVRVETVGDARVSSPCACGAARPLHPDRYPGRSARDAEAAARIGALRERCAGLQLMLVLPASAQGGVIEETVVNYRPPRSPTAAR